MYAHLIDKENIKREAVYQPLEEVENLEYIPEEQQAEIAANNWKEFRNTNRPTFALINPEQDCLDVGLLAQPVKTTEEINEDIIDPS